MITVGPDAESLALRDKVAGLRQGFFDAMSDDFNTSLAISYLFALAKEINVYHNAIISGAKKPDGKLVEQIAKAWREMLDVIGILENEPAANGEGGAVSNEEAEIAAKIEERQAAESADFKVPMPSVTNWRPKESSWKTRPRAYGGRESEIRTVSTAPGSCSGYLWQASETAGTPADPSGGTGYIGDAVFSRAGAAFACEQPCAGAPRPGQPDGVCKLMAGQSHG